MFTFTFTFTFTVFFFSCYHCACAAVGLFFFDAVTHTHCHDAAVVAAQSERPGAATAPWITAGWLDLSCLHSVRY
jgi:hypothetical protein